MSGESHSSSEGTASTSTGLTDDFEDGDYATMSTSSFVNSLEMGEIEAFVESPSVKASLQKIREGFYTMRSELDALRREFPQTISEMESLKENIDKVNTMAHKLTVGMAPISIAGGTLVIAGTAGALPTAGTSLALTAIGGLLLGGSVLVTATGDVCNTVNQYRKGKQCNRKVNSLHAHYENAKRAHEMCFSEISKVSEALKSKGVLLEDMEDKLIELIIICLASGTIDVGMSSTAKPITNVTRVVFSSVGNIKTISQLAKIALSPAAKAAAKALSCIGHTFCALGIVIDCSFALYSCYCLWKNKKCSVSKDISFMVDALKLKKESLDKCYEDLSKTKSKLNLQLKNAALVSKNAALEKQKTELEEENKMMKKLEIEKAKLEEENKKMAEKLAEMELQLNQAKQIEITVV